MRWQITECYGKMVSILLTDDSTRILAANVLNYLNINLENATNFNVDFHNSQNDISD